MMGRPLHAVMVTPTGVGGHPRYTWELLTALRGLASASQLRLTMLTSCDLDPEFRDSRYNIADVLPATRHRSSFPNPVAWAASRIIHYARRDALIIRWLRSRGDVDIAHFQEAPFLAPMQFRRVRASRIKPVATVHNVLPHRYPVSAWKPFADRLAREGWRRCAALFVHSARLKSQLEKQLGFGAPPITVVPHGVWRTRKVPHEKRCSEDLLLFGVLRRNKGINVMLDAMHLLPGMRLTLAGAFEDSAFGAEVRDRIAKERLNVRLIDRAITEDEVGTLFSEAAVAVLPYTDFHAQSGVLHLAIAHEVPSVVTEVGGLADLVHQEGVGVVTRPMDARSLAEAVLRVLEPPTWQAAVQSCRDLAGKLSWDHTALLTLQVYEKTLEGMP